MIFGISGTKRTVRYREVSVRRGYTVLNVESHNVGKCKHESVRFYYVNI